MSNLDFESIEIIPPGQGARFDSSLNIAEPIFDLRERLDAQAVQLANHAGQLSGFAAAIQAVQASLGSWITAVLGLAAIVATAFGILIAYTIGIDEKVDQIAMEVKGLPAALSNEMLSIANTLAGIGRGNTSSTPSEQPSENRPMPP
jgi:hypothetical protein